jgi:hypothetical protein
MEETKREKPPCKTERHNEPASSMRVIQTIHRSPWKNMHQPKHWLVLKFIIFYPVSAG